MVCVCPLFMQYVYLLPPFLLSDLVIDINAVFIYKKAYTVMSVFSLHTQIQM